MIARLLIVPVNCSIPQKVSSLTLLESPYPPQPRDPSPEGSLGLFAVFTHSLQKLPELGRVFGRTIKEFKDSTRNLLLDDPEPEKKVS
ncbi:twin-arginine translocase TatA/TatE family subunit [Effusibacillus lacus]|uniref:Uncharacterized protein n=1 Tax=Effusibacillus lacus TaxID=1348429 RepID=A0A292YK49_9BACL|nr:twin-arginine translocase TatA/TatE family subunit [Effusibacillus lacus]GAX88865.1 hypothetical protein EFBL_0479 [Effusibacillus lacus]